VFLSRSDRMDDAADPLLPDQITSAGDWVLVLNLCTTAPGLV
jgi:hypothetical protein